MANKRAFKEVCASLDAGNDLTLADVEAVFGADFSMMLIYTLMDANDAARAIQGAIARLSTRDVNAECPSDPAFEQVDAEVV